MQLANGSTVELAPGAYRATIVLRAIVLRAIVLRAIVLRVRTVAISLIGGAAGSG